MTKVARYYSRLRDTIKHRFISGKKISNFDIDLHGFLSSEINIKQRVDILIDILLLTFLSIIARKTIELITKALLAAMSVI